MSKYKNLLVELFATNVRDFVIPEEERVAVGYVVTQVQESFRMKWDLYIKDQLIQTIHRNRYIPADTLDDDDDDDDDAMNTEYTDMYKLLETIPIHDFDRLLHKSFVYPEELEEYLKDMVFYFTCFVNKGKARQLIHERWMETIHELE